MTEFGHYRLDALVGRGGMGEVYRAFDTRKGRTVALKLLAPHLAGDAGFQDRFRRESELAARLREPHVIPIHDYGEIDGRLYIDMRLVDGTDLETVVHRHGPMPPARALHIVAQVAGALDAAHVDGLIHRDVKPSNVLLVGGGTGAGSTGERDDFAYLVDFGIAAPATGHRLTMTGTTLGSMDYMAPELFDGDKRDNRIDVYSLTGLLYTLLTARKPFAADGFAAMMFAHLTAARPKPSDHIPQLPASIDAVIARGMATKPEERYQRAGEVVEAAREAFFPGVPVQEQPTVVQHPRGRAPEVPSASRRPRLSVLVAAVSIVAVAALIAAVTIVVSRASPVSPVAAAPVSVAPPTPSPTAPPTRSLAPGTYVDVNKRFTILPPPGWTTDASSLLTFSSPAAPGEQPAASIVIWVVTAYDSLETSARAVRAGVAEIPGSTVDVDQPTTLPDGTAGHLIGSVFNDPDAGGAPTHELSLVVVNGSTMLIARAATPADKWAEFAPEITSSIRTFSVTTGT
ncbi:serine/threonine-protein kinase [Pseudonocardia sp. TRM90224]|uniref:serine/threonine-protein kinase n=1 Tax=Pseudonocardia sp. TRM90224 TaxID=2812678 RepID=UPI001E6003F5|nr:serine/threonine-protein kinase [Pseudonocardia sp. TRM90224]